MEVTDLIPANAVEGEKVSIFGNNFGNDRGSIWLGNHMIQPEDQEHLTDWQNNRIDIKVPGYVPKGDYTIMIQNYNKTFLSNLLLKIEGR
jgi:hypothetical protein